MSALDKVRKTAQAVQKAGNFCISPVCLHSDPKCKLSCCSGSKKKTSKKRR